MRKGMEPSLIEENGTVIGVFLSADFTAEHEWGIQDLRKLFGMTDDGYGIERRRCRLASEANLRFFQTERFALMIALDYWDADSWKAPPSEEDLSRRFDLSIKGYGRSEPDREVAAAWDGGSFGVMVPARNAGKLREIYDALLGGRGALFMGGSRLPAFENPGMILAIVPRMPKEALDKMEATDRDAERLLAAAAKTGIVKRLEKTSKGKDWRDPSCVRFMACSPRWLGDEERESMRLAGRATQYDVIFWLNPYEQQRNNYGWFTVEELDQWIEGHGPIPKQKTIVRGKG